MNQEIKAKWLEALRSGRYKQGVGCLRSDKDEYCCLGVLCDVVAPEQWNYEDKLLCYTHANAAFFPGDNIKQKIKLPLMIQEFLSGKNDGGDNFHEIAEYIEKFC